MLFSLIKQNNETDKLNDNNELDYETYFDWLTNLLSTDPSFFEGLTNFKKYFKILLSSLDLNSSPKIIEFFDFLYKTFNENFISAFKGEIEDNKKNYFLY